MRRAEALDRIRGALYGVAVGDALGGPLEFMSAETIQKKYGTVTEMIGGGWLDLRPGETTDDTAMTIAVARGITENPKDPVPGIGARFIEWAQSKPKDIGMACRGSIIQAYSYGGLKPTEEEWLLAAHAYQRHVGRPVEGNGALMRTIYPALYYTDRQERLDVTKRIAKMTHAGKVSAAICQEYVELVHDALTIGGANLTETIGYKAGTEPTGYVIDSYSNALEAIYDAGTFEEALIRAVNRGGDADTIGAIAGGLAGAIYGYKEIPDRWIACLDESLKKEMDRLAAFALANHPEYSEN